MEETEIQPASEDTVRVTKVPGVNLEIGLGEEVVLRVADLDRDLKGRVVGLEPYEYIIAKARMSSEVRKSLSMGGRIVVKYILDGTVYGFRTDVLNVVAKPTSLIFFAMPNTVEKLELRKSKRYDCRIESTMHTRDADYEALVVNISTDGCMISTRCNVRDPLRDTDVDDTLVISMAMGSFGNVKIPVAVKNVSFKQGVITLGCMYLNIDQDELSVIEAYMDKLERLNL